jgi:hypothetical protein
MGIPAKAGCPFLLPAIYGALSIPPFCDQQVLLVHLVFKLATLALNAVFARVGRGLEHEVSLSSLDAGPVDGARQSH